MKISAFSVKNPQFTLVAFLCLAVLGVTAFQTIPRAEDPYFPTPNFAVIAVYPGASPAQVEREVIDKLESELAELSQLKRIKSKAQENVAFIEVEFEHGVDTEEKDAELRRQVAQAERDLPAAVDDIDVIHFETTNVAVLQLALLRGEASWATVEAEAERLKRRLQGVRGVKDVNALGFPPMQARVELSLGKAFRAGTTPDQIMRAVEAGNRSIPGGAVDLGARRINVQTSGAYASAAALAQTVVGGGDGAVVTLGDVASVRLAPGPDGYRFRHQGARAALLTVSMREGENIFEVRKALLAVVEQAKPTLAAGLDVVPIFDQSRNVQHRLGGLQRDLMIAICLVLITLIPLGLRASLVVMVSIPMSLAIGIAALRWLGYSLNQLSIVGFVIALGLLVDDSIVVAENIMRWLRQGATRSEAAIQATKQIGVAVLGCTATLVFAFVPLLFLPGSAGEFIRSLPAAVVVTILASLLVSLTLIPFLSSRVLRGEDEHGNAAFRVMSHGIERAYRPVLDWAMRRPKTTLALAGAVVAACFALVPAIGFSLFPKAGIPQIMVELEAPDGTSLDHTDALVAEVEAIATAEPAIATVSSSIGRGHPQIYYNVGPRQESSSVADVLLTLKRYDAASTPAMLARLQRQFDAIPGVEIAIREFENGPPVLAPIEIRVLGDDFAELARLARQVEARLAAVPGTTNIRNPLAIERTDLRIDVDERKAGLLGVVVPQAELAIRMAISGLEAGALARPAGSDVDIVVGVADRDGRSPAGRSAMGALDRLEVPSTTGAYVPLAHVADWSMASSPRMLEHYDRQRVARITADVALGHNVQQVMRAAYHDMDAMALPAGYRWEPGGLLQSQQESFAGLGPAVVIAIFGILAILVLEFGSFAATLIVATVIPLGAAGGLLALFLAGETLSFTASIGFIALIGIEVKNSLLLVDFTNQLRADGAPLEQAIRKAGEIRFFPILLTSLTAIGGLIPLVLEHSALYSPLALVLIGGLVSSTLLSRLVTPVMSLLLLKDRA